MNADVTREDLEFSHYNILREAVYRHKETGEVYEEGGTGWIKA